MRAFTLSGVMALAALFRLLLAAAGGFRHRALHRARHRVRIEDHFAVDVAGGAADGLDQRGFAAQEAFLVGVEDRDQRTFRDVEPFAHRLMPTRRRRRRAAGRG